jgi:predicted RNA-binding protein YlxR (DUF448 family)
MPSPARPVLRRCVACRQLKDRVDLWRLVRLAGGGLALDAGMGRSAYLCPDPACLEDARRRRRLQRSLRCAVEEAIYTALEGRLPSQGAPTEAR